MQARAPYASARTTSWPERMPPSNITSITSPTASATLGSVDVEDALEDELAGPEAADPFDVLPIQRRIELVRGPLRQRIDVLHAAHVAGEVAEGLAPAAQDRQ